MSCSKISEADCAAKRRRIQSFKQQREILSELRRLDKLSKKKFNKIDGILAEEEKLIKGQYVRKCGK
jgi:hypothetical protein